MEVAGRVLALVAGVAVLIVTAIYFTAIQGRPKSRLREGPARGEDLEEALPFVSDSPRLAEREPSGAPRVPPPYRRSQPHTVRVVEVTPEVAGLSRRQFFNRALLGIFATFLVALGSYTLAFFWPRLKGGFGSRVDAGSLDEIRAQLSRPDGTVAPFVVSEARAYVIPISAAEVEGSQFGQDGLAAEGLMALWWRCVHLGCRTPWCETSVGFECPCHGSKYNYIGEYQAGPAPRNLDRFKVEVSPSGRLLIDTGSIIQTPRAPRNTVDYPQGPSCIAL